MDEGSGDAGTSTGRDCVFHVGDDHYKLVVRVNKQFLAVKSVVFEKMFDGTFLQEEAVKITDVSPEAFIIMLKFLRGEPYNFWSKELAVNVMHVAEKYELLELKQTCEDFLLPRTVVDVWWVAPHAYLYNSVALQEAIRDLLSKHTSAFIFDENFLEASEELVLEVVRLDSVADVKELEIFKVVVEWAEYQLAKQGISASDGKMLQKKLQKILEHIRLDVIRSEDQPALPQFLNSKQIKEILRTHTDEKDESKGIVKVEEVENKDEEDGEDEEEDYDEEESEGESDGQFVGEPSVDQVVMPGRLAPRRATPITTRSEQHFPVEVVARNPADVRLCYRKKTLQESVSLVQRADLVLVVVPSKLPNDTRSSHYWDNLQVSVTCTGYHANNRSYCQPRTYGSGYFKGVVTYGQEIHVPITRSAEISNFSVSGAYPLTYNLTIYFNGQGLYPWQSARTFPSNSLLGSTSAGAGCVMGYRFRPC